MLMQSSIEAIYLEVDISAQTLSAMLFLLRGTLLFRCRWAAQDEKFVLYMVLGGILLVVYLMWVFDLGFWVLD